VTAQSLKDLDRRAGRRTCADSASERKIEQIALRLLRPSGRNARTHSKKQIRQIANSIARFGWTFPILIDEDGSILAGHARYEAAILLGFSHAPVIVVSDLSGPEKRALMLADNRLSESSSWDRKLLATELTELAELLPEVALDLDITGFESAEIDSLLADFANPDRDPADNSPPPETNPISRTGDVWLLGEHRLLCGSALVTADYKALMKRQRAVMMITDPPYNVRIKDIQGRGKTKHREFLQASGEMSSVEFQEFLQTALTHAAACSLDGSLHLIFMDWRHADAVLAVGAKAFSELKNIIVWVKSNGGQGSLYRSQHEFVFLYKNGDAPHVNNVELGKHGRNRTNVWHYAGVNTFRAGRMDDLSAHPTVKPVAMIADALLDCSKRGDIVLDPFMGSGTTIIAAERVGRRAYGLELDPAYVDVAVRRWQTFTRRDATLESTGQTFDEVEESRSSDQRTRK
jgi:DNA modification methylase